ncbi:DUF6470 family protein [Cohnella thailandensis]|uniref:Uncharacterized protein n=1 Tax=Cohnella thailandensis TaxID=557557 RepID=A0A841SV77_9BACL|nr:DUF6470 family protein [Cohnella thailandensis]MBB6632591.1 hypothetical protein [Cohnella thailandensis]MBP1971885.1 hypothetical protein [Cohnella thailandensis]
MIGQISIHSDPAILAFEGQLGKYDIKTHKPQVNVESRKAVVDIQNNGAGTLEIDMTLTNDAIDGGSPERFWNRIYSQYKQIAADNLVFIVEKGNTIGDLRIKQNPLPDYAIQEFMEGAPDLQVYGPALPDNTKLRYTPTNLDIQVTPGEVNIDVQTFRPDIQYNREYVNYYMKQYPKVTITPPAIDVIG